MIPIRGCGNWLLAAVIFIFFTAIGYYWIGLICVIVIGAISFNEKNNHDDIY